ncbi:MAG: hypothetical protein KJO62_03140 [Gammaproteobacteria bacterium]|nr:hypothetical protein [Gammaproteobacteria bacterium]NNM11418.1 hypothetical protein [Pseudomonadales bacterium]RZV50311.1 MAG: hypothetical protein EX270_11585 [Pseudomonadales bacterium]
MPAAFASGAPLQLCHSVFPISFLQSLAELNSVGSASATMDHSMHHMHHAHHAAAAINEGSDGANAPVQELPTSKMQPFCSFSALSMDDTLISQPSNSAAGQANYIQFVRLEGQIQRQRLRLFQSRAPPLSSLSP